jgi:hypothetical protein
MSNSKPLDTLNEQMNLLVESQAQEIKELISLKEGWEVNFNAMKMNEEEKVKENKKLKEENEKLKEEVCSNDDNLEQNYVPYEDYATLDEENEKLKEKINGYDALLRCEGGVSIEKVVKIKGDFVRLKNDNDKLKMENKLLKGVNKKHVEKIEELDRSKLRKENEKLKEQVDFHKECYHDQQKETDIEHVRYLESIQDGSDKLCEVAHELGIEHHGGNKDIICEIKKLASQLKDSEYSFIKIKKEITEKIVVDKDEMTKLYAAAEALSFMDYKYEDGEWKPNEDKLCQGCGHVDQSMTGYCDKCIIQDFGDGSEEAKKRGIGVFANGVPMPS